MAEHDPLFDELLDFAEGRLDAETRRRVEARLRESEAMRSTLRDIEAVLAAMRQDDAGDAPDLWRERAARRAVPRRWLQPMRGEHLAELAFDSATSRLAGVRAGRTDARQVVLRAERLEIELHVSAEGSDEPFAITGQVMAAEGAAADVAHCEVLLVAGGAETASARTDELGEFVFRARPAGSFALHVRGADWLVRTETLTF